jgi:thiol-disulfide isomerase/thioredoxin
MRRTLLPLFVIGTLGCGESTPAPPAIPAAPASSSSSAPSASSATTKNAGSTKGAGADDSKGAAGAVFTVKGLNTGKTVSLAPGKVTIVDFWATWCEPCKKSFPKLQELYVKYQSAGLEIIGLSEDDDDGGIVPFASQYKAKFPVALDKGKALAEKMKPKSMPTTFLFDKKGKQRFEHSGYHDGEEAVIEKEIKQLLSE